MPTSFPPYIIEAILINFTWVLQPASINQTILNTSYQTVVYDASIHNNWETLAKFCCSI
jgi:hypothetical protein